MSFNNIPKIHQKTFIKVPNGLIDLSENYNSCLNLVYVYLMINRNMLGKTNTSVSDIQRDILKTRNQNVVQKRTDQILESYYILSNSITKKDNSVIINSLITIEKYENMFDFGELDFDSLKVSLKKSIDYLKNSPSTKNIKQLRLSILPQECEDLSFTKLYLQEYMSLMKFVYNNPKNKNYKITTLLNLYLFIKKQLEKKDSFRKKFSNKKTSCRIYLDSLINESSLSRDTLKKYLDALCELNLLKPHKQLTKIYYTLNFSIENSTLNNSDNNGETFYD